MGDKDPVVLNCRCAGLHVSDNLALAFWDRKLLRILLSCNLVFILNCLSYVNVNYFP